MMESIFLKTISTVSTAQQKADAIIEYLKSEGLNRDQMIAVINLVKLKLDYK